MNPSLPGKGISRNLHCAARAHAAWVMPGIGRQDNQVIADIRELQQAFDDAELHADTDRLNTLLADDEW